jgi:hypothetical protein
MGDEENVGTPPGTADSATEGTREGERPPRPRGPRRPTAETRAAPPAENVEARQTEEEPRPEAESGETKPRSLMQVLRFKRPVGKRRR